MSTTDRVLLLIAAGLVLVVAATLWLDRDVEYLCDRPGCTRRHRVTAWLPGRADRKARAAGWTYYPNTGATFCPDHTAEELTS